MNSFLKPITKILIAIVGVSLLMPVGFASASSLDDLIKQQQQVQKDLENQKDIAAQKQAEANRLGGDIKNLVGDITNTEQQISQTNTQISSTQSQIGNVKLDVEKKQKELNIQQANFGQAVVELYRAGRQSDLEKLFSSKDLSDALEKTTYLDAVQQQVNDVVKKITESKKSLESKQSELENKNEELNGLVAQQNSQKNALTAQRNTKSEMKVDAEVTAREAVASARAAEAKMGSIDDAIENALRQNGGQSSGSLTGKSVARGAWLGNMGSTGNSSGAHLHFEVRTRGGYNGDGNATDFKNIGYYNASSPAGNCSVGMDGNNLSFGYGFSKPLSNPRVVTSCFPNYPASYGGGYHGGIDMVEYSGAPVHAARDGVVVFHGWLGAYGNAAIIYHGDGVWSLYAHML